MAGSIERTILGCGLLLFCLAAFACGGGSKKDPDPVESSPMYKVRMADSLMNAGRVGEALSVMQEAVDAQPDSAPLHHQQGQLLFRAGRYDEAEVAFRKSLELDPYMTDARNYLGTVYQEEGRYADAEREYLRALDDPAYPTPEKIYFNLGLLYENLGRDEEAISQLRLAVAINTKYYKAHFQLASLLERTGNLDEAAREYEVAEPGFLQSGDFYYRKGLTYFRLGEMQEARDSLSRALNIAPGTESAASADELLKMMD